MNKRIPTAYWLCRILCLIISSVVAMMPAAFFAHGIAGQRFFPTTFAVADPFISDEFSILYNFIKMNDEAGGPRIQTSSFDIGYSKRIFPNFGIELDESYQRLHTEGDGTVSGFGNLGEKYQFHTSAEHETILSFGVSDDPRGQMSNHLPDSLKAEGRGGLPPRPFSSTLPSVVNLTSPVRT